MGEPVYDSLDSLADDAADMSPYDALCLHFDVAHALYWLDPNAVPASWRFGIAPSGGLDYAECLPGDDGCATHTSGECLSVLALLFAGDVNLADPYGDPNGRLAERALIALGDALEPVGARYDG